MPASRRSAPASRPAGRMIANPSPRERSSVLSSPERTLMPLPCPRLAMLAVLSLAPGLALADEPAADDAWFRRTTRRPGRPVQAPAQPTPSSRSTRTRPRARIAEELKKAGAEVTTGRRQARRRRRPQERRRGRPSWSAPTSTPCPSPRRPACPTPARRPTTDDAGKEVGVMHACGHDVHMTCLVGTARWLAEHKDRWSGTVVLIGQPAEEAIGGRQGDARRRPLHAVPQARLRPGPARRQRPADRHGRATRRARRWPARPRST